MATTLTQEFFNIAKGTQYADECVTSLLACDEIFQSPSSRYNLGVLTGVYLDHKKHAVITLISKLRGGGRT